MAISQCNNESVDPSHAYSPTLKDLPIRSPEVSQSLYENTCCLSIRFLSSLCRRAWPPIRLLLRSKLRHLRLGGRNLNRDREKRILCPPISEGYHDLIGSEPAERSIVKSLPTMKIHDSSDDDSLA